ncbi:MAG: hypothetical protein MUE69_02635 [Myxococcota bacterium]|jgi:hypothetical protein|nr:hypothetical protein [Myxococcota bacterium]
MYETIDTPRPLRDARVVTYRDDLLALRERWRDDRERHDRALQELGPRLAAVRSAEERLLLSGAPLAFRASDPPFGPIEEPPPSAPREVWEAALARLGERLEEISDEARWLEGRRKSLEEGVDRAPLAAPPRVLPFRLALAEWLGVALRVSWLLLPLALVARATLGRLAVLGVIGLFVVVTTLWWSRRAAFLRQGVLASTRVVGTRASLATMTNWPIRRARGWGVDSIPFTGQGTITELVATTDAGEVPLQVSNVIFHDGMVLVRGARAMATLAFHCAPVPTPEGTWSPRLTPIARRSVLFGGIACALMLVFLRF